MILIVLMREIITCFYGRPVVTSCPYWMLNRKVSLSLISDLCFIIFAKLVYNISQGVYVERRG